MSGLDLINVRVESNLSTGNVLPLLYEIRHAIEWLIETGEETVIDLRSIPLAPGEEEQIEKALGHGEVSVQMDALGPSRIVETAIPGAWLVSHLNSEDEIMGRVIEVTIIPSILKSQIPDMREGLKQLDQRLAELGGIEKR